MLASWLLLGLQPIAGYCHEFAAGRLQFAQLPVSEPSLEDLLLPGMEKGIQGDYQGAIAEFTQVIRRYPYAPEAYYNRGIARSKMGDRQGAMADYDRALRLNPDFAEAYAERGLLRFAGGEREDALADLERAAELSLKQGNHAGYELIMQKIRTLY